MKKTIPHKPRILIISAIAPFPMESGGAVRAYQMLKELSKSFEVYYIYFVPFRKPLSNFHRRKINTLAHESFECQMSHTKTHAFFLDQTIPLWFSDWYVPEVALLIQQIIKTHSITCVHVDFTQIFYILRYLPDSVTKIAGAIDIVTVSFWRRLRENRNPLHLLDHFFKFFQVYIFERKTLMLADVITVMSNEDERFMHKLFPFTQGKTQVVRNGLEIRTTQQKQLPHKGVVIGFIGSFNHPPNRSAVKYIFKSIVPRLKRMNIPYSVLIAGNTDIGQYNELKAKAGLMRSNNIRFLGYVENISSFYSQIDVLVAPIFSGSGTRIKILESLGNGVPVISTHIGAEGITIDSPFLTITDNPDTMTARVEEIYYGKGLSNNDFMQLKDQLREYTWTQIFSTYALYLKKTCFKR